MTNEQIIALLNEDMKGEHMAIVQYLRHAYAMGEGEMACEIEGIAREEMRHFDWLAEMVVELGGKPSLERADFIGFSDEVAQNMRFDVQAEEDAIALYREHLEAIDDPKVRRLLARILSDEESHHGDFLHFVDKAEREAMMAGAQPEGDAPGADVSGADVSGADAPQTAPSAKRMQEMLNYGIEHEYTVILQYLYHSYLMPDCEVGNELETQAINEMQHLGWLSEEMEGLGGTPNIEHTGLSLEGSPADMLKADINVEREVTAAYSQQIPEIKDEGLRELITRIRDHEIYHIDVFSDLLAQVKGAPAQESEEQEAKPAPPGKKGTPPSVGSLFGREQE